MTTNSSALVPRSKRALFALQAEEWRTKLSFTEKCAATIIVFSPYLILKMAVSSLVLLIAKPIVSLMAIASFATALLILPKAKEWILQRKRTEACRPLLEENTDDYLRAQEIGEALEQLARPSPSLLSTTEPYLEGEWTPLCFESKLRPWMREELQEHFSEESCPLDCVFVDDGHMLLDHSTLVFARNTEQKLLRVILPLPSATEELFESTKDGLTNDILEGTHVNAVVEKFSLPSKIVEHINGSKYLGVLQSSCQKPLAQRPPLKFKGVMVKEGVAIATAISVGGEETTLFPSVFFEGMHRILGVLAPPEEDGESAKID